MREGKRDPELIALLIQELTRHLGALTSLPEGAPGLEAARRAVHALKGSAGLAGERELASALERVERRIREGHVAAPRQAVDIVQVAVERLAAGKVAVAATWPDPPLDLVPTPLDPAVRDQYVAEVADRLAGIDETLAPGQGPQEALQAASRHVHTLKGAASAVGDEPMAWFCHGLEERLGRGTSEELAGTALEVLARWRPVLGGLATDPEGALTSLRAAAARSRGGVTPAPRSFFGGGSSPSIPAADELRAGGGAATIRVAAASIDQLLDRLESISLVREQVGLRTERARIKAARARRLRSMLAEALRLIGPPRPWGAPAAALRRIDAAITALGEIAEDLEVGVATLRLGDQVLRETVAEAKRSLAGMRLTSLGGLFGRLTAALEQEGRRAGRTVIVRVSGADETVDRRVAERLLDPCLQLVRNAVAHGIEPAPLRVARGKAPTGTLTLSARRARGRLVIAIQDDGAGVDLDDIRRRAVAAGFPGAADPDLDEDALLSFLFLPGFSTREGTDLLAGRGLGLDIARGAVQKLGGTLRLFTRPGEGFTARIDLPVESGVATVLWVTADGETYALPGAHARGVRVNDDASGRVPHLATCLAPEAGPRPRAPFVVDLELHPDDDERFGPPSRDRGSSLRLPLGVDEVGITEEVLLRPLSPLLAGVGPFAGAVVRGDGLLRLALDAEALAPRIRAHLR